MEKLQLLKNLLRELPGAVIAFSGGVDSTFLAFMAKSALGDRVLAVTAVSPTYPEYQLKEALSLAKQLGIKHQVIYTDELSCAEFVANSPDRCYYCKLALFKELKRLANDRGQWAVLDGANVDDQGDYRPGHRAAREMGVRSPLQEAGITKAEIRQFSKELGLPTWDKPAYACLASRIPYNQPITREALKRIEQGEAFLLSLGLREVRLRDHYPIARIEVGPSELELAWQHRTVISAKLHELGYPYVTLDLDGYRTGSMNEILNSL